MDMRWPVALVVIVLVILVGSIAMTYLSSRSQVAVEEAKGKYGDQYRTLTASYEELARSLRDSTVAMQADLAAMRQRVDSIEKMMREVN